MKFIQVRVSTLSWTSCWCSLSWYCLYCLASSLLVAQDRQATPVSSITVRPGFEAQLLRSAQAEEGSWVSLTFDPLGQVILGLDESGIARLTASEDGSEYTFKRLDHTDQFRHVRGLLYAYDSLYACATDSQALYRLRSRDGSVNFNDTEMLMQVDYRSRYGHGTNQIVQPPALPPWGDPRQHDSETTYKSSVQLLYLIQGNDVSFPDGSDPNSPYRNPQNDWLLPSPHDGGHDNRVGHIIRLDAAGKIRSIMAGGFRNQFDVAFNEDGEMFTWDADMEWDVGLPWYRPTRLNHVVSGGEYGWRWGTGKWPDWFPDSLPSTLDTGLGSPTGLVSGVDSGWPERYRRAIFMADWQNGRVLLVDLIPDGASYTAHYELFLDGGPLNVCDLTFGPDGDLYFITGGRGSQSGLYRVKLKSASDNSQTDTLHQLPEWCKQSDQRLQQHRQARQLRHKIETYQTHQDPQAIEFLWPHLGSHDRWIRFAARVALENQQLTSWRQTVVDSTDSLSRRMALLALARVGTMADQAIVLKGLNDVPWKQLSTSQMLLPLRTLQLSFIRQGAADQQTRQQVLQQIDALFPQDSFPANWLLAELLVYLDAPDIGQRLIHQLQSAPTQEEQVQYAKTLMRIVDNLDTMAKQQLLSWLIGSRPMPGGKLVATVMESFRQDLQASLSESEKQSLAGLLEQLDRPMPSEAEVIQNARSLVQRWTMLDFRDQLNSHQSVKPDREKGQAALAAASCLRCHRLGQRGGQIGPDLTNLGKRMDSRALLESILTPSQQIDPKYQNIQYLLDDGQVVTGRTTSVTGTHFSVELDPLTGKSVTFARQQIEHSQASPVSPMPEGLLDTLTKEDIDQLLAYLLQRLPDL